MFNALNIFYNTRKTPDFSGFPVILPNPNRITKQKSEVFDNQRLPIFFIVFLASFWRDNGNDAKITMNDSALPPKIAINQNMDYPPHEIFLRSHTSLIPKLEFQPA